MKKALTILLIAICGIAIAAPVHSMLGAKNIIQCVDDKQSDLPAEYREVKYLRGNGTAYLKVDFPASTTKYIRYRFKWKAGSSKRKEFNGERRGDQPSRKRTITFMDENGRIRIQFPSNYDKTFNNSNDTIIDATLDNDVFSMKINDSYVDSAVEDLTVTSYAYDGSIFLFCVTFFSKPDRIVDTYLGRFEFWNSSDAPFSSLIPCVRIIDEKPGMYDKVRNTFYSNVATTGNDFTWEEL